jgi:hypothetical protein
MMVMTMLVMMVMIVMVMVMIVITDNLPLCIKQAAQNCGNQTWVTAAMRYRKLCFAVT